MLTPFLIVGPADFFDLREGLAKKELEVLQ